MILKIPSFSRWEMMLKLRKDIRQRSTWGTAKQTWSRDEALNLLLAALTRGGYCTCLLPSHLMQINWIVRTRFESRTLATKK